MQVVVAWLATVGLSFRSLLPQLRKKKRQRLNKTGLMGIILLQKPVKLPCRMQLGWNMKEFCTWQMSVYKRQRGEGRGEKGDVRSEILA